MPCNREVIVEQMMFRPTASNKIFVNDVKMYIVHLFYLYCKI